MKHAQKRNELRWYFIHHALRNLSMVAVLIIVALGVGMWGYHVFDNLPWVNAFVNAAMILSGMGPVDLLNSDAGKIFAGCYALFSGLFFILIIGLLLAPFAAHEFKMWHLETLN